MIILVHGEMGQWMMLDNQEGVGLQGKVPGAVPSRDGQETQCYVMATALDVNLSLSAKWRGRVKLHIFYVQCCRNSG